MAQARHTGRAPQAWDEQLRARGYRVTPQRQLVLEAVAKLGPQPPNFEKIVALNRGPLLTSGVEAPPPKTSGPRSARPLAGSTSPPSTGPWSCSSSWGW